MKTLSNNKQGFTIIEVVLVLAIAGLIFLMVFVALPSLQRSQRDTQRRQDIARVATALTNYQANNGSLPSPTPNQNTCEPSTNSAFRPNSGDINPQNTNANYDNKILCIFIANYLNSSSSDTNTFKDPDGTTYGITMPKKGTTPSSFGNHMIYVNKKHRCTNDGIESTSNPNDFAILYKLEGSGTICIDNQ